MDYRALGRGECWDGPFSHVIGSSELVDLWEIRIKKPMILCARSTSRSSEQRAKRRSRSENMRKVCLFYNQNSKILWLSNMAGTLFEKFTRCVRISGLFFLIVLYGCWLAGQANSDHVEWSQEKLTATRVLFILLPPLFQCSVTCGQGAKERRVQCQGVECDNRTKPASRTPCSEKDCPQWREGPWNEVECSVKTLWN